MGGFAVHVTLIVTGVDLSTGERLVLVEDGEPQFIPSRHIGECGDMSVEQHINSMCRQFIDLHPNWLETHIVKAIREGGVINICYRCIVPMDTNFFGCHWMKFDELTEDHRFREPIIESVRFL